MNDQRPLWRKALDLLIALGATFGLAAWGKKKGLNQPKPHIPTPPPSVTLPAPAPTAALPEPQHPEPELRPGPDWSTPKPVTLPQLTYWPMILAAGVVFLAWGVVTSYIISLLGALLLCIALIGWIGELRHEH